jgi:hypothetical protein
MKIKYAFITALFVLLGVSLSQVFTIPPFAGDIFGVYKSGYFSELERGFLVITDAFIETKMVVKPEFAWVLLDDIKSRHRMDIRVFNSSGVEVIAPGRPGDTRDRNVQRIINSMEPRMYSRVRGGRYYAAVPVYYEDRCRFCHDVKNRKNIAGVLTFERDYDAHIYYTAERIVIFGAISLVLCFLLFLTFRWDPERGVKELFDKS